MPTQNDRRVLKIDKCSQCWYKEWENGVVIVKGEYDH